MRKKSRKNQKIAVATIVLIIALALPIYYFTCLNGVEPYLNLEIKGKVYVPANCTLDDLVSVDQITLDVNSDDSSTDTYAGVSVALLLYTAKMHEDATSAIIQSADGTSETFTLDYIFADNVTMIMAYVKNNMYMSTMNDGEGPLRLIISNEQDTQKSLKDVVSITVE
ncbi:MAG: hypothetical protein NWF01_03345 [Candidatus Bathyarchaeota archaeon]|nr:hypothetical protein [Candidatus Bathyarchaeota archaeon]